MVQFYPREMQAIIRMHATKRLFVWEAQQNPSLKLPGAHNSLTLRRRSFIRKNTQSVFQCEYESFWNRSF